MFRSEILRPNRDSFRIRTAVSLDPASWHLIDCTPQIVTETGEPLLDVLHFAPLDRKRIILPEDAVPDLMARILQLQQPAREQHFLDQARNAKVHAQLISIPS